MTNPTSPPPIKIGGLSKVIDNINPTENTDFDVGVFMKQESHPPDGSDDKRKLILFCVTIPTPNSRG